jgi:exosortase
MGMAKKDKIRVMVLFALWLAAFAPIYPELVRDWLGHSDNSHAFLVPPIATFFVWRRRKELQTTKIGESTWGGLVLILSLIIYLLSYAGGTAFPARVAMVSSLLGIVWFCLGNRFMRILAFPILFLLFMVPLPYSMMNLVSMPLQLMATRVSAGLIEHCSIPVFREGNMLFFAHTQLEVAEACSGIRSIMSLTMLGLVFGNLSGNDLWKRVTLVAMAIPIAILANIARITGTGILAHFYGDKVAKGFLHEFSGMVVFVIGFMLLMVVYVLMNRTKAYDID